MLLRPKSLKVTVIGNVCLLSFLLKLMPETFRGSSPWMEHYAGFQRATFPFPSRYFHKAGAMMAPLAGGYTEPWGSWGEHQGCRASQGGGNQHSRGPCAFPSLLLLASHWVSGLETIYPLLNHPSPFSLKWSEFPSQGSRGAQGSETEFLERELPVSLTRSQYSWEPREFVGWNPENKPFYRTGLRGKNILISSRKNGSGP